MKFWEAIRAPFAAGALMGAALFLLPLPLLREKEPVSVLPPQPTPAASQPADITWDSSHTVRVVGEDGVVEKLALGDYLWRVVAAEMPASFEPEALRAQAVCARTYTLWKMQAGSHGEEEGDLCVRSACCQAYTTPEQAAQRWGEMAEEYTRRIADAVADTDGQVLLYEDEPIQAVFFSSSTATTEAAEAVWGSALDYLVPVDSPEGEEVPNYRTTVVLTARQVRELVEQAGLGADLSGAPEGWLGEVRYTDSGRVARLELGGVTLTGSAARTLFSLRSACFTVEQREGVFTFSVVGYGHGVGMSQYGANAMARQGSGWEEIVTHYYTGVSIGKADWPEQV